jgi:hypothetical protein
LATVRVAFLFLLAFTPCRVGGGSRETHLHENNTGNFCSWLAGARDRRECLPVEGQRISECLPVEGQRISIISELRPTGISEPVVLLENDAQDVARAGQANGSAITLRREGRAGIRPPFDGPSSAGSSHHHCAPFLKTRTPIRSRARRRRRYLRAQEPAAGIRLRPDSPDKITKTKLCGRKETLAAQGAVRRVRLTTARHTSTCRNTRRGAMTKFMHADAAGSR